MAPPFSSVIVPAADRSEDAEANLQCYCSFVSEFMFLIFTLVITCMKSLDTLDVLEFGHGFKAGFSMRSAQWPRKQHLKSRTQANGFISLTTHSHCSVTRAVCVCEELVFSLIHLWGIYPHCNVCGQGLMWWGWDEAIVPIRCLLFKTAPKLRHESCCSTSSSLTSRHPQFPTPVSTSFTVWGSVIWRHDSVCSQSLSLSVQWRNQDKTGAVSSLAKSKWTWALWLKH